jgi:hypothetical protein
MNGIENGPDKFIEIIRSDALRSQTKSYAPVRLDHRGEVGAFDGADRRFYESTSKEQKNGLNTR